MCMLLLCKKTYVCFLCLSALVCFCLLVKPLWCFGFHSNSRFKITIYHHPNERTFWIHRACAELEKVRCFESKVGKQAIYLAVWESHVSIKNPTHCFGSHIFVLFVSSMAGTSLASEECQVWSWSCETCPGRRCILTTVTKSNLLELNGIDIYLVVWKCLQG